MFLRFGTVNIWPTREEVDKAMPEDLPQKYESSLTAQR